jgi:hypothetical protein
MKPLAPSVMEVFDDDKKTMAWPLAYAAPGEAAPPSIAKEILDKLNDPMWSDCEIETMPSKVVAVGSFADARWYRCSVGQHRICQICSI